MNSSAILSLFATFTCAYVIVLWRMHRENEELRRIAALRAAQLEDAESSYMQLYELAYDRQVRLQNAGRIVYMNAPHAPGVN